MSRVRVAKYNGISLVVVERDLFPPDTCVVVIPPVSAYPLVLHLPHQRVGYALNANRG